MKRSMSISVLIAVVILAILPGPKQASAVWGSQSIDGMREPGYTLILNGTSSGENYSVYQANTAEWAYFYFEGLDNFTIDDFTMRLPGITIDVNATMQLAGVHAFAFTADRRVMECALVRTLVQDTFTFEVNGQALVLLITWFTAPSPPPKPTDNGFGLTEFMALLGNLAFANSWVSVLFWVIFLVWLWRSMTRKIWIIRKDGSLQGVDYGRWIKEESVKIGNTRFWRHTFKTDVAKTCIVQEVYSQFNKEELLAKAKFKRVNGFWLVMPYVRIGTLKLRPDQYFYKREMVKSPANWFWRILYYVICWVPKLNDEIYRFIKWAQTTNVSKEIPYLFITYAEDRVTEVYPCTWKETQFDIPSQKEATVDEKGDLTKEEIELLKKEASFITDSLKMGDKVLRVKRYENIDEALNDKFTREELMAVHRFKESALDNEIGKLNNRLSSTIDTLESERRKRIEDRQTFLDSLNEHTSFLEQNVSHYIARAIGLKSLGAGSEAILEDVTRDAMKDYLKHTDEIKHKAMLEKEAEIKKLNDEKQKLQNELDKKTNNDIVPNEITIEHQNSEGED